MKKLIAICLIVFLVGSFTACKSQQPAPTTAATSPSTQGEPTNPQFTAPAKQPTEPEPTVAPAIIAPQLPIVADLVLQYAIGDDAMQTVENPVANDIYQYLLQQRSAGEEKFPTTSGDDLNNTEIYVQFMKGDQVILRAYLYADDFCCFANTPKSEDTSYRFFKLPQSTYGSVLLTLQDK